MKAVLLLLLPCFFLIGFDVAAQSSVEGASAVPAATTTQCPAGQYDMLDWATLDPDLAAGHHLEGNHNPLYTVMWKDKFYWLKSANGFPWDIQLMDKNYIYLWVTEKDWLNPKSYKKSHYNTNMPLTTRCAKAGKPGTAVFSKQTAFEIVQGCTNKKVQNLGWMINQVWGPYKMNFGGNIPSNIDTLVVSYRYTCNQYYNHCQHREDYYLTKRYGLVKWDHAMLKEGKYVQDSVTIFNRVVRGGPPAPYFPCM